MKHAKVFFLIFFLGILLGCFVGGIIDFLPGSGVFTSWELLESPVKLTQIVDINSDGIWAQTTTNQLYFFGFSNYCSRNPQAICFKWIETASMPSNAYNDNRTGMSKGKDCPERIPYPKEFPKEMVECAVVILSNGSGMGPTYFALLKDGTLWKWARPSGTDIPVTSLFVGPFIGMLLGAFVGACYLLFQHIQQMYRS